MQIHIISLLQCRVYIALSWGVSPKLLASEERREWERLGREGAGNGNTHMLNPLLSQLQVASQLQKDQGVGFCSPGVYTETEASTLVSKQKTGIACKYSKDGLEFEVIPRTKPNRQHFWCAYWRLITMSLLTVLVERRGVKWVSSQGGVLFQHGRILADSLHPTGSHSDGN